MNIKTNHLFLAALPAVVALAMPAFAQDLADKSNVNSVQLAKGGQACAKGGGSCEKGGGHHRGGPGGERRHHHGNELSSLQGEFALTPDQTEKLSALRTEFKAQIKPKFADMISNKRKMFDLLTQSNIDKAQVLALQSQINASKDAFSDLMIQNKIQQMSILTDQQKQELRRESQEREQRHAANTKKS